MANPPADLPRLKDIVFDLQRIVRDGVGSVDEEASLPTLGTLVLVRQEMQGGGELDLVVASERVIARGIETLEGSSPHEVLRLLFGLTASTRGRLAKQRRKAAAERAGSDPATFNRHDERRYLRILARSIYALESEARLLAERLGSPPDRAEIKANWLGRFTRYHRVAAILRQLRLDLLAVLVTYRKDHGEVSQVDYLDSTMWYVARFLYEVEEFNRALGGIWFMPERAADDEAKVAIDLVLWHQPFNERGRSWLRIAIAQVPAGELFDFAERLHDGPDGNEMLGLWEQWLKSCRCDLEAEPDQDCRPHRVIDQAERFDIVVEEQWPLVRERYRLG